MQIAGYTIVADYHTHTRHSHGSGSVLDNVEAAHRRGLQAIAITDHGPASLFHIGVSSLSAFDAIRQEVNAAQKMYPGIEVLLGAEANVISEDGQLDIPLELQEKLDIVLVGLHPWVRWRPALQGASLVAENLLGAWTGWGRRHVRERNTSAVVNAVLHNRVHAVTHPGYRLPIDTRALARACASTGCAMEINAGHDHTSVEYIQIARKEGARFLLSSDAHTPGQVGEVSKAAFLARAAGLKPWEIVNAR
ncbi:MAG TPA: PHP domain-containing protein [Limnochordia bacterium]|nr:PHP domain-containing protein [Limnochordia bacterium]